jgi:hypothetical protein
MDTMFSMVFTINHMDSTILLDMDSTILDMLNTALTTLSIIAMDMTGRPNMGISHQNTIKLDIMDLTTVSTTDMVMSITPQYLIWKFTRHTMSLSSFNLMSFHIMITMRLWESIDVMFNSMRHHSDMLLLRPMLLRRLTKPLLDYLTQNMHTMPTGPDLTMRFHTMKHLIIPNTLPIMKLHTLIMDTIKDTETTVNGEPDTKENGEPDTMENGQLDTTENGELDTMDTVMNITTPLISVQP